MDPYADREARLREMLREEMKRQAEAERATHEEEQKRQQAAREERARRLEEARVKRAEEERQRKAEDRAKVYSRPVVHESLLVSMSLTRATD